MLILVKSARGFHGWCWWSDGLWCPYTVFQLTPELSWVTLKIEEEGSYTGVRIQNTVTWALHSYRYVENSSSSHHGLQLGMKLSSSTVFNSFVSALCSFLTFQSPPVTWCTNSLTFNNCTFCPHCIYVFCIYLRTNSELCHLQHKLSGLYNRDEKCLLRGTNWVFK